MRQILLIALLSVIFNTSQAWIVVSNCPGWDESTQCLSAGLLDVELSLTGKITSASILAQTSTVDFIAVINNVDGTSYTIYEEYDIPAIDLINSDYIINIPSPGILAYSFMYDTFVRNSAGDVIAEEHLCGDFCGVDESHVMKINSSQSTPNIKNVSSEIANSLNVFPNPFNDHITIEYFSNKSNIVNIQVFDLSGVTLHNEFLDNQNAGFFHKRINNLNIPPGIYICGITTQKEKYDFKITKM